MEHSHLARLPPELRNNIWHLVLTSTKPISLLSNEPALLRTCRQIRNETQKLYYSINTFDISTQTTTQNNDQINRIRFLRQTNRLCLVGTLRIHCATRLQFVGFSCGTVRLAADFAGWKVLATNLLAGGCRQQHVKWDVYCGPNTPKLVFMQGPRGPAKPKTEVVGYYQEKMASMWETMAAGWD